MKNLFKTSTIALVILSLFVISCGKPKKGEVPAPPAPKTDMEASVNWTLPGNTKSETGSADKTIYGPVGIAYLITPKINIVTCTGGIWKIKFIEQPMGSSPGFSINEATGASGVTLFTKGTYKVKITYYCKDCIEISIIITFKVE